MHLHFQNYNKYYECIIFISRLVLRRQYGDVTGAGRRSDDLYGFVTDVTIVNGQECTLGETCDGEGNKISNQYPQSRTNLTPKQHFENYINRQSRERFRARGGPRCRVRRC